MTDDAERRGDPACGDGTGKTEAEGIMYTKLKDGSLKLYELEKELPRSMRSGFGDVLSNRRPERRLRISASFRSISSAW